MIQINQNQHYKTQKPSEIRPTSMPAENLTFTSEWEEDKYTITYYVNGETTETEAEAEDNGKRAGYSPFFIGKG